MNDRSAMQRVPKRWLGAAASAMAESSLAALMLFAAPASAIAQTLKPALKPLDVFDLQWVSDPEISPDGRSIAYGRKSFDIKTDRQRGVIWLVGADGKRARPLSGAVSSAAPRWSPDGSRLACLGTAAVGSAPPVVS